MPNAARRARLGALLLSGLALVSCIFDTAVPGPGWEHELRYRVNIGGKDSAHFRVTVRVLRWPKDEPLLFQAPLFYADNPAMPLAGLTAADFSAKDSLGGELTPAAASGPAGLDGNFVRFPPGTRTITWSVDQDIKDPKRFGIPMPGLGAGVQLIDGAYFFIFPVVGESRAEQWRRPVSLKLDFHLAPGYRLVGQDTVSKLRTNYELMFVRAAVNPLRVSGFTQNGKEIITYATTPDTFDIDKYNTLLKTCLRLVEDSILPLPEKRWFAGEAPIFWGIEGTQGHWFRPEAKEMIHVHTHELIHTFVGVRHGEREDPWWKEGVTNYLGELLPLQAGLYAESLFIGDLLWPRDTMPAIKQYPLASAYVRTHLFAPLDTAYQAPLDLAGYGGLVYGKGGEAAMILDRYLMENSQGRASIFHLVRRLAGPAYPTAFTRADLVAAVSDLSGRDAGAFLTSLLDTPGPFSSDSLRRTYDALKAMGRFLPGVARTATPPVAGAVSKPVGGAPPAAASGNAKPPQGAKL